VIRNNVSLKIFNIEKERIENKNVIITDTANMFAASIFLFGNIIATSYFPPATMPRIEQMLMYKPYIPKSCGVKYWVKMGVIIIGINCAIEILVTNVRVLL